MAVTLPCSLVLMLGGFSGIDVYIRFLLRRMSIFSCCNWLGAMCILLVATL